MKNPRVSFTTTPPPRKPLIVITHLCSSSHKSKVEREADSVVFLFRLSAAGYIAQRPAVVSAQQHRQSVPKVGSAPARINSSARHSATAHKYLFRHRTETTARYHVNNQIGTR